ncbi:MAG: Bax inhibitor-1 family protein [Bacteroidia bacterium]
MEKDEIINSEQISIEQAHFITKVYGWMALGLTISGLVAYFTNQNSSVVSMIFDNSYGFWLLLGLQIGVVIFLTKRIDTMSANVAVGSFLFYSIVTGVVFSAIFMVIAFGETIAPIFFIIGATFAAMSILGYFTKTDLTSFSRILIMALVGLLIAAVANYLMDSSMFYYICSFVGVLIFTGLIVIDTKKIKEMNKIGNEGSDEDKKEAIMGALCLYIVF